jgi:hypothetical protein
MRVFLLILGTLAALLIVAQLVMGQLLVSGVPQRELWMKRHQHTGYLTVAVSLVYIAVSLIAIASAPRREKV